MKSVHLAIGCFLVSLVLTGGCEFSGTPDSEERAGNAPDGRTIREIGRLSNQGRQYLENSAYTAASQIADSILALSERNGYPAGKGEAFFLTGRIAFMTGFPGVYSYRLSPPADAIFHHTVNRRLGARLDGDRVPLSYCSNITRSRSPA